MLFSSTTFLLVFLPIVLLLYYTVFLKHRLAQNIFLFFVSLIFYAWGEPWFVLIMLLSIVMNWIFGLLVDKYRDHPLLSKLILTLTIVYNLVVIFIFKYLIFTITNVNLLFHKDFAIPEITLPIGISFFTFQAISYVIDVYRRHGEVQKNPLNVGLYIAFFPQLIAGPIVRYETIAEQILYRKETFKGFSDGVIRFIRGLAKKVLLSNTLAIVADLAFSTETAELSVGMAWLGAICYTLQIFFDFSGYSEMAIGLGKMFGFDFLENFNFPYISASVSEFWRRWHISLGTWFKDYVYFPLGGSRVKTKSRLVFNLFVVWFLTGLWHGANWTFIAWGLLYFVLLTLEKLTGFEKKAKCKPLRIVYTLLFVIIGWVLFRSNDIAQAGDYLKVMFTNSSGILWDNNAYFYLCENAFFLLAAVLCSTPIFKWLSTKCKLEQNKVIGFLYPFFYLALFIVSLSYIVKGAYNPFIYFNF
ncbi:MAG: MBOAT family protein [Lachnospiraceae bacterium]|nr:MBOAT family protein [Lachnospiraceae bacterium]